MHDGSSVPGASGVTVRQLQALRRGDADLLRDLRLAALQDDGVAFLGDHETESCRSEADWCDELRRKRWFAALVAGEPVGLACLCDAPGERPSLHLESVWVRPDRRGTGVAQRLVSVAESCAAAARHEAVALWVIAGNARARDFYEAIGYRPTGRCGTLPDGRVEHEYARQVSRTAS